MLFRDASEKKTANALNVQWIFLPQQTSHYSLSSRMPKDGVALQFMILSSGRRTITDKDRSIFY